MKVFVSTTEYAIVIDLEEANLWEWLTCLEEQYPLNHNFCETKTKYPHIRDYLNLSKYVFCETIK